MKHVMGRDSRASTRAVAVLLALLWGSLGCDGCGAGAPPNPVTVTNEPATPPAVTSWTEIGRLEAMTITSGTSRIALSGLATRSPLDQEGRAVVPARSQLVRSRVGRPWDVVRRVPRAEVPQSSGLEDESLPRPIDVSLTGDQGSISFRVGRSERHEAKMATWVHVAGTPEALLVDGSLRNLFLLRPSAWTESSVVDMPMGSVERVVLHTARGNYALVRRGLNWESDDGRAGEVDPARVRRLISRLERLEPISAEPSDPAWVRSSSSGGVSVSDGLRTIRLHIGTQTAPRPGQPEPISPLWIDDATTPVLVRASHAASLQLQPIDLQRIVVWELDACDVQAIRGNVEGRTVELVRASEACAADDAVAWTATDLPARWAQGDRLVRVLLRPRVDRRLAPTQPDGSGDGPADEAEAATPDVSQALGSQTPTGTWTITMRDGTTRTLETLQRSGDALARYARTDGGALWLLSEPTARTLTPPRGIGDRPGIRRDRRGDDAEGSSPPPTSPP